jgi:hypothetical protein
VSDWRKATAKALDPWLANFRRIDSQVLRTVRRVHEEGCLVRIILDFGQIYLFIEARTEDDTVEMRTDENAIAAKTGVDASESELWSDFIGQPFGWGWATVNQQGYCDGVLLSFSGITPRILLSVAASSIDEMRMGQPLRFSPSG